MSEEDHWSQYTRGLQNTAFHHSSKLEEFLYLPTGEWTNKLWFSSYCGILYSNGKEHTALTQNMIGSHKHNVGLKEPDTEEYVSYDPIYIKIDNRQDVTIK